MVQACTCTSFWLCLSCRSLALSERPPRRKRRRRRWMTKSRGLRREGVHPLLYLGRSLGSRSRLKFSPFVSAAALLAPHRPVPPLFLSGLCLRSLQSLRLGFCHDPPASPPLVRRPLLSLHLESPEAKKPASRHCTRGKSTEKMGTRKIARKREGASKQANSGGWTAQLLEYPRAEIVRAIFQGFTAPALDSSQRHRLKPYYRRYIVR